MHVVMLSSEYPPRWGGMGSTVYHLSAALASLGHKITIITRNGQNTAPALEGVEVLTVPWKKIPMEFTRSYGRYAFKKLKELHALHPVDIVHLHCPMVSWDKRQFEACKGEIAPIVSSLHGSWLGERDGLFLAAKYKESAVWANPNDLFMRFTANRYANFENIAINFSDVCVANSNATKDDFLARYSSPENWKCEVIHWGVDTDMFFPLHRDDEDAMLTDKSIRNRYNVSQKSDLLLSVGRLVARKGFGILLQSFAKVKENSPNTNLVIVGRGGLKSRLLKQAKKLGLEGSVFIESSMKFDELAALYRTADLVVYPSYYEGQGLIPLEAMASATPVVTVNNGPLPEMVDDSVGGLFTMGDINSISESILSELKSKQSLLDKGIAGRRLVIDKFTFKKNANDFLKIYKKLIN
ncbi:MAG: glycosyltransferase family 4 protein [Candidatus Poseidoniales archaeon]|jgi:glycosyltransferase involved in cell wall biosynthesis